MECNLDLCLRKPWSAIWTFAQENHVLGKSVELAVMIFFVQFKLGTVGGNSLPL